jgi:hypothetical protein
MNKHLKITGMAVGGLVLTGILMWGAGCTPPRTPAPDQRGRYQIVSTVNGTYLVDTQTGDSWIQINTVWVQNPKATLAGEIYQMLLNQAFRVVGAQGTATPNGTMTPGATATPGATPTMPAPRPNP